MPAMGPSFQAKHPRWRCRIYCFIRVRNDGRMSVLGRPLSRVMTTPGSPTVAGHQPRVVQAGDLVVGKFEHARKDLVGVLAEARRARGRAAVLRHEGGGGARREVAMAARMVERGEDRVRSGEPRVGRQRLVHRAVRPPAHVALIERGGKLGERPARDRRLDQREQPVAVLEAQPVVVREAYAELALERRDRARRARAPRAIRATAAA